MTDWWVIVLAPQFFASVPLGLILVALGVYNCRARTCIACGYSREGLARGARCPECGAAAAAATTREVPRNSWQVRVGVALLIAAALPVLALAALLVRGAVTVRWCIPR